MKSISHIQLGLIGTGMLGRGVLPDWQSHPKCTVKAVADVNIGAARAAAEKFGVPDVYEDYHEMLADDTINAIHVCTPHFLHCEHTVDALNAGKHVLCEKPFAIDVESANAMVAAAEQTGLTLGCCSARFRFSPLFLRASAMIRAGELGDIYFIHNVDIRRRFRPGLEYHPTARWRLDKTKGGGTLLNRGCYDLDTLWSLLGGLRVKSVKAFTFQGIDEPDTGGYIHDVEEHAVAWLSCEDGLTIVHEGAEAFHGKEDVRTQIYGSRGGLELSFGGRIPTMYFHDGANGKPVDEKLPETGGTANRELIYDFIDALLEGREPATPGKMAAEIMRITMAIYESAATGRTVEL